MPKLKVDDSELDINELEEAEYSSGDFQKYTGDIPKTGTMLLFRVTKVWWSYTKNDEPMLKVLCVAEDNPGDLEEFDGLPAWENMALTAGAKFRWAPFMEHFGLTLKMVKSQTMIASEDDNFGAPIEKIGKWVVGSDDCLFVGVVAKEKYQGNWQAHISEWLDADTAIDEDEDAEEEPEEKPARRQTRATANGARKAPARATGTRRKAKPEPEEDADEPDEEEAEEEPAARTRRTRTATATATKPARRGTRRSAKAADEDEDEPPF